ncbi:2-dehydro-3-deoxygalactonokinase [Paraglaciecola arctica]|uniref:2-dehydro-3-deoxygalactonokinase n=1 Tax=Paraglaciecola arctica TaxID=1128911 RepID=UPI001C06B1AF|nr:2-dehydro-3-deoxygalactonokinase [Paraglaciecola arctica]
MKDSFVALDWGTTKLQAYWFAQDGQVLGTKKYSAGIGHIERHQIEATVLDIKRRWQASIVYASGMIGSALGWEVVPYQTSPASLADLSASLVTSEISGMRCFLVPGLKCRSAYDSAEVMRGEELEVFGWLGMPECRGGENLICLPGTHTKWVVTQDEHIQHFHTALSSELYDCLAKHSVLRGQLQHPSSPSNAFLNGVKDATSKGQGLTRLLFGVRAKQLMNDMEESDASSYCRGLLIGHELADAMSSNQPSNQDHSIPVIGNEFLAQLYISALEYLGYAAHHVSAEKALQQSYYALNLLRGERDD